MFKTKNTTEGDTSHNSSGEDVAETSGSHSRNTRGKMINQDEEKDGFIAVPQELSNKFLLDPRSSKKSSVGTVNKKQKGVSFPVDLVDDTETNNESTTTT